MTARIGTRTTETMIVTVLMSDVRGYSGTRVREFRMGAWNEGGAGVTIAVFA